MLLPEPNRSNVPYFISATVQCGLVLLLAIPWTVQTLRSSGPIQVPVMLNLQSLKPVETVKTTRAENAAPSRLPVLPRIFRPFALSPANTTSTNPVTVDAPEIGLDLGAPIAIGVAGVPFSELITHPIPAPIPAISTRPKAEPPGQLLVGGNVQEAKLIHRVQPLYPALARQVRVQGVVKLEAIIAGNGSIQQLHVLSGHPMLIPSAVEAVRQWIYSPTILNGKAVEVKTTIEVRFTLSDK